MAEFETLQAKKVEFNQGGEFVEVSLGIARDGTRETRFARLSRGFYDQEGEPRYRRGGVTLPLDAEVLAQIADAVREIAGEAGGGATGEPP